MIEIIQVLIADYLCSTQAVPNNFFIVLASTANNDMWWVVGVAGVNK